MSKVKYWLKCLLCALVTLIIYIGIFLGIRALGFSYTSQAMTGCCGVLICFKFFESEKFKIWIKSNQLTRIK